ncbi:MAG: superoxide dismutase [Anaerolineaceae bacterium]|jgi:Fe-Mn family superoxide dismutase|nr:superoxide dismutase [Anaerolineaceae bacterium]NTV35447.1 superoxide dismutase [Anaerolineaceae bacterium]
MSKLFELPALKFDFAALEPVIDARTMEIHHDKHHAAYVNNLNKAFEASPDFYEQPLEKILREINSVPEAIRTAVRNNGGGHANHTLFWELLAPGGKKEPYGLLAKEIENTFGGFATMVEKFNVAATTRFGSGWAWLVVDQEKKLQVYSTPNQDSPLMEHHVPVLALDVWEHAYYLNYQNRRPDYVKAFWSIVNWDAVNRFYEEAKS